MTPAERARGRFMRAPDGHGSGEGGKFTQADLDAAIEKAVGPLKDSIGKLETKNDELIGENRKLKRGAEIKPEDLTAAEDRADKAEKALAEAQKEVKTLTGRAEKAEKALETETGFTSKLLIQDGLKSALIANGVKDEDMIDVLVAKFAGGAKVTTEGEERKATIGDKALADHIKEWAASDAGKKFVAAPTNSGGGAGGGDQKKKDVQTITRSAYNALDQQEKGEMGAKMAKGEIKVVDDAA
jgi:hypothetical protein